MNRINLKRLKWAAAALSWTFLSATALGQLQLVPDPAAQAVFSGVGRPVRVTLQNPDGKTAEIDFRIRLHQTSSATTILIGESPWKKLQVLPGQTVLESAPVTFPTVKAETRFLIQWLDGASQVIGKTDVMVYPPDLLKELKPLCGDEPLGVFDPQNLLKPLLKTTGVEISDLEDAGFEDFHGKLAILGPFQSKSQMRESLPGQVKMLAGKGVAVVWLQPPPEKRDPIKPSFYTVPESKAAVVVVQAGQVAGLTENPQAQVNLIHFSRLAHHPEPLRLPTQSTDH
jgi:hypothetical protein